MVPRGWQSLPRVGVMGLAVVLLACLNAPATVAGQAAASRQHLASPGPKARSSALGLESMLKRFPQLAAVVGAGQPRPGRLLPRGPRPADPWQRAPSIAELRAGRMAFAQLLEPTQPYVPVSGVAIKINFDRQVSHERVERSFTIQPATAGRLQWLDDRTLAFQPDGLAYDTTYSVRVAAGYGVESVAADWLWAFTTVKALTISIDDCASTAGELRNVLAVLAAKHIKAVMFPTGLCNSTYPWLVPQMLAEGHTVCNHTYSHPRDLTKLSDAQISSEIRGGVHAGGCNLFRPPWGAWDGPGGRVERIAASLGYKIYLWDVDALDWAGASSADMLTRIRARGGVILLHYHGKYTVDTLRQL